jgi:hypothetical protein
MYILVSRMLSRASALADVEPLIALFVGATLLAVFLTALCRAQTKDAGPDARSSSLIWTLYRNFSRFTWALALVLLLIATISVLRSYLRQTVNDFRAHARPRHGGELQRRPNHLGLGTSAGRIERGHLSQ